jgi:Ca-activated chloride channel family protein
MPTVADTRLRVHDRAEAMFFLWPESLWLLLLPPLLPLLYLWLLRRGRKVAVRYSSVGLVREAAGRNWKRHVPPALLLLACTALLLAASRPVAKVPLPWGRTTIMLAMDISLSMRVADVQPTRMAAAQAAARQFLQDLPRDIDVGLVTFAGTSQVAQRATPDRAPLLQAIDNIQMQRGTAIGSAIVVSLSELFPDHGLDVGEMTFGGAPSKSRSIDAKPPPKPFTPVAPGSYNSAAIILLSDGRRTTGIDALEAAKLAADRGVRIYVVGLGTPDGAASLGEYMSIYLQLDEPTLREVARLTGGEYHHAGTAEKLRSVYETLGSKVQLQARETEITALLALASALLTVTAALLSLLWFRKL